MKKEFGHRGRTTFWTKTFFSLLWEGFLTKAFTLLEHMELG